MTVSIFYLVRFNNRLGKTQHWITPDWDILVQEQRSYLGRLLYVSEEWIMQRRDHGWGCYLKYCPIIGKDGLSHVACPVIGYGIQ